MVEEKQKNSKLQIDWQLISILIVAFLMRFIMLGVKPPHHDEGINGWFADQMTFHGFYRYDPTNYHGPLHFYIVFLFQTLFGRDNFILRFPTAFISLLTVYWVTLFSRFFGRNVVLLAAFVMAISPGMTFYGRYAIHESDFVFFTILIFWGILGLWKEGSKKYLWSVALGITGLIVTKETYIIHLAAFGVAWYSLTFLQKYYPLEEEKAVKQLWDSNYLKIVIVACIGIIILFYSGIFLNPSGVFGLIDTFKAWFATGTEHGGHSKPFYYWFKLILKYELVVFCGILLSSFYFSKLSRWMRFIFIYGIFLLLVYSGISYKTPWCIVSIIWPFYFVFAELACDFFKSRWKSEAVIIIIGLSIVSIYTSIILNFFKYDDNKEPYVYVHTFRAIEKITDPLLKMAKIDPVNYNLVGHVLRSGEWPLPWILGDFTMIGFYGPSNKPSSYDADFLLVESGRLREVEQNLQKKYFIDSFIMRDSQDGSKLFLNHEKFKTIFPNRSPEFNPSPLLPGQGLLATYYPNKNWQGKPAYKFQVPYVDFYWEGANRILPPPFSSTYTGEINIPRVPFELILASDDGGFIELDGQRILNDPGPHGITESKAIVSGSTGWRKIKVGFYDDGGGAVVKLIWVDNRGNKFILPKEALRFNEGEKL